MLHLRSRLVSSTWQIAAMSVLVLAGSRRVYACDPSYANGLSNDDMYMYATTTINDPNGSVQANVILVDPQGHQYEVDGTPQNGVETTNLDQGINGIAGDWTNNGVTYDYGVQYVPTPAADGVSPPYIQITSHTIDHNPISVSGNNGPTCGTDTVQVYAFRAGLGWPTFTVRVTQAAGSGTVSTWTSDQERTATSSLTNVYVSGGICAVAAGSATIRGEIVSFSPSSYSTKDPNPIGNRDATFTVAQ